MKYEPLTKLHNILIGELGGTTGMFLAFLNENFSFQEKLGCQASNFMICRFEDSLLEDEVHLCQHIQCLQRQVQQLINQSIDQLTINQSINQFLIWHVYRIIVLEDHDSLTICWMLIIIIIIINWSTDQTIASK